MGIKDISLDTGGKLPIREFHLEDMAENPAIVMVAKRGSGKSWLCRKILKQYQHIPVGLIIAKTDRMNTFYGNFFPDLYIHYEYKTEIIQKLLSRQQKMIAKRKEKKEQGKKVDSRAYIIMDDCLADSKSWVKDQPISELLYNGRHYDIMYILTMQVPLGIGPNMRKQFDYIFLFAEEYVIELKKIYLHYAGLFPTFEAFRQVFSKVTEDYCCMVLVNTTRHKKNIASTGTFLDKIFWFKADNVEIGDLGCGQFNMYHKKNYDTKWSTRENKFDMDTYCNQKKRDKSIIKIDKIKED